MTTAHVASRQPWRIINLVGNNTLADLPSILRGLIRPLQAPGKETAISEFEATFAAVVGGGHAYSFGAGRVALAAILDAYKIGPGDEVIVPAYTCVAVPNPILFRGARPIYADIDPTTLNLDPTDVARKLTPNTRAIIVQHTFGLPVPLDPFRRLVGASGIPIIEDCTHALGSSYGGKPVGSEGDAAFFSSEQTKSISTAAGGIAFTRNPEIARKLEHIQAMCTPPTAVTVRRQLGYLAYLILLQSPLTSRIGDLKQNYYLYRLGLMQAPVTSDEEMRCEMPSRFMVGFSAGLARVGCSQLRQLQENIRRRREIVTEYERILAPAGLRGFPPLPGCMPNYVRWPLVVGDKLALFAFMRSFGIQTGLWFTAPVHPQEVPQSKAGYQLGSCPNAEAAVRTVANLPCHPRMTTFDARRIADLVLTFCHESQS